ncbi:MAG: thioredoxin domain-containing protein, partial [Myxococcales bacterium]|nr:thioredoxin domain-containing protein [Myxococcales bacterium]
VPPTSVNDSNFESEVLRSDLPVILDVWSPGCAPCKQLEEVIFGLSQQYRGQVKVCEMNSAGATKTAMRLRISGTPSVVYFRGGREVERVVGFRGSLFHRQTIEEVFEIPQP